MDIEEMQILSMIGISFAAGMFIGALIMHHWNWKTEHALEKELDAKTRQLNQYENKYHDDGYEAY